MANDLDEKILHVLDDDLKELMLKDANPLTLLALQAARNTNKIVNTFSNINR